MLDELMMEAIVAHVQNMPPKMSTCQVFGYISDRLIGQWLPMSSTNNFPLKNDSMEVILPSIINTIIKNDHPNIMKIIPLSIFHNRLKHD